MSHDFSKYFDKKNLHHAYLIEGEKDEILPSILKFLKNEGTDLVKIEADTLKIDDARSLKSYAGEKSYVWKRFFIVSANGILLEAQNSLLKMFEGPIENTHFFLIMPDAKGLLKTFVSRFYLIDAKKESTTADKEAQKFIQMPPRERIDYLKELLVEEDDENEEGTEILALNSKRSKALSFLNSIESALHAKSLARNSFDVVFFEHIFKVRKYLRMPGSSAKSLMESVALVIPIY